MIDIPHTLMLNHSIIDKRILIALRNQLLKSQIKLLITFLIFWGS
jgi:hypothetical protein